MNDLSDEFGFRKICDEDVEYLRGRRPREILKHLGISIFKLPFVIRKVRREINSNIAFLSPSVDLLPMLKLLKKNGCQIGIVTTNIEENVKKFLHANNLDQFDLSEAVLLNGAGWATEDATEALKQLELKAKERSVGVWQ